MPTASVTATAYINNLPVNVPVYKQYFAGTGVTETINNPGNDDPETYPPVTTALAASNSCDAVQQCAAFAANARTVYYSFDVHYLITEKEYECVAYLDRNYDSGAFNVQNADVGPVYGYYLATFVGGG